ncbi:MAG: zinc-dependent metalloprotease [Planctomycetota bacterium]
MHTLHLVRRLSTLAIAAAAGLAVTTAGAQDKKPDFPDFKDVAKGFEKVVSPTTEDGPSLYTIWVREKDGQMLAELPRGYERQKHFFAMTVGTGELFAGLQGRDLYTYWKRYNKRLALMAPQVSTRSTGDQESKDSVENIFTDRVLLDIPIVCMGPSGQPVIDLDDLLAGKASNFFGRSARGANPRLAEIVKAKAFPKNIEIAIEMPTAGGILKEFHYSISRVEGSQDFKPRKADQRIGNFTTTYRDLGKFTDDETIVRYANRWNIQKRDPSLKLSPPKEPVVFYIEHTVPVRYRRFVREGVEYWNRAFAEQCGILDAIEVRQQDSASGSHMDKDPEDVRYNFIRWLSNDIGTAIGPSRAHPETGEILDADVILTDGWIRYFNYQYNDLLPDVATEGFSPKTLAWLEANPQNDPRILLADPAQRDYLLAERKARGVLRYGGHPASAADASLYGDQEYDGLANVHSQFSGFCNASHRKAMDLAMMHMHLSLGRDLLEPETDEDGEPTKPKGDLIDGMPDWFIGPMLADLVAHEVGHTLGFSHNFKASSMYDFDEVNSEEVKGRAFTASVMDYNPINIHFPEGGLEAVKSGEAFQGDYAMVDIGVYDEWIIAYTYGDNPEETILRGAKENIPYANDIDAWGIDPLARRYDFAKWPLDYTENQIRLINHYRSQLLTDFVEDGDSWAKARRGYNITLNQQMNAVSIMANWIGGAYIERDKKGDPDARDPLTVVEVDKQRAALDFVLETGLRDDAFGLTPELMTYLTTDLWWDQWSNMFADRDFPVHDRVNGMMLSALTMIMNPDTLGNVFDNEFRVPAGEDAITLAEVMEKTIAEVFNEIAEAPKETYTSRDPMISSFRRNLQLGMVDRLINFTKPGAMYGAAATPVRTLSTHHLRNIKDQIDSALEHNGKLDAYTASHLAEASIRIERALEAEYIYNASDIGGGGNIILMLGQEEGQGEQ